MDTYFNTNTDGGFDIGDVKDGDLLRLCIVGVNDDDNQNLPLLDREWFVEAIEYSKVMSDNEETMTGLCRGVTVQLVYHPVDKTTELIGVDASDDSQNINLANRQWVRTKFPEWQALLSGQELSGEYPRSAEEVLSPLTGSDTKIIIQNIEKVTDYHTLKKDVYADPSYWCDGTPANFTESDPKKQATLNAGEILALIVGQRSVVLTQLWAGWVENRGQQPIDAPFALRALREAIDDGDISVTPAPIPGMPADKGLTAILTASASPWMERAVLLQSFGAQAALVAGSPYYQTLVGKILGYKDANIDVHVKSKGGRITPAIANEVTKDLAALSTVEAEIPWRDVDVSDTRTHTQPSSFFFLDSDGNHDSKSDSKKQAQKGRRGKKKKRSTASSVADVESMFGKKGR